MAGVGPGGPGAGADGASLVRQVDVHGSRQQLAGRELLAEEQRTAGASQGLLEIR